MTVFPRRVGLAAALCGLGTIPLWSCGGVTSVATSSGGSGQVGTGGSATGGSSTGTGGSGTGGSSAGAGGALCGGAHSPPVGRPQSVACPATDLTLIPDAGVLACSTDADCQATGSVLRWCFDGQCRADQCLTDSDCPIGQACGCGNQFGGNALHTNRCVPSGCRVDADCGPNGVCSATTSSLSGCGGLAGYYCHSSSDSCSTDVDCCGTTPVCAYQPTLGHWACQAPAPCIG